MKFCDCLPSSCPFVCQDRYQLTFYPLNSKKYTKYTLCFSSAEEEHVQDLFHVLVTHEEFNGFMYDPDKVELLLPIQFIMDQLEEEGVIDG